jgi:glycosyltransferase involved in cell wall biosynthesis
MDMRDPWSLVERLAEPIDCATWRWLARRYERRVVPAASLIVTNTEPSRDAMQRRYPALASRIVTVMNGFDDDPIPRQPADGRFVIAYAGTIYLDRDPRPLFEAAARVIRRHRLEPHDFGIRLVGAVANFADTTVSALVRRAGLEAYVEIQGQRSRKDLWDILARATVLVSLPQDSHMAIPSKVFEYMQFEAWLLAMAEPDSATGRLLQGTAAAVVGSTDVEALTARLEEWFERHRRGERPPRLADDARFGRRHQAGVLFARLEQVIS